MDVSSAVRAVRIFVSSPADVAPERGRVQAAAAKLNRDFEGIVRFDTVLWEEHFYKADRSFQPQIQKPEACDILVSIFWTRIGTELPGDFGRMANGKPYPSGTAYELLTALEASRSKGVPDVYVFRKTADAVLPTADLDRRRQAQTQLDALEAFWSEWFKSEQGHFKAAFQTFANTDEFERQIELLLRQWLDSHHLLGPRLKWPKEKGSPFPGLAAFGAEHAAVFFGRDRATDEARRRLAAAAENAPPFLLIVGASGSGKSSLARAGLIPRLTAPGVVAAVDLWRTGIMKPGEGETGPVSALAAALFAALPELAQGDYQNAAALADNLRRGGEAAARPIAGALARIAAAAQSERQAEAPLRPALVLLVDQLEELFAQAVCDEARTAFAEALTQLLATGQLWCIATLRADLYESLLKQPALNELKEAGASLDLGPPGAAELAEIVRAPAAAAGLVFENSAQKGPLDERLLADAKTADSLPLLQFTLRQLYERREEADGETRLTHAAYEELGGLQGAIAAEAERAVANLPPGTLDALPRLLRQLAQPAHNGATLTLREAGQAEISAQPAEAALVDALLGARILIARHDAAGRPTLRLAHDAVLTSWPKAAAAAQASREFYRVRAEVEDAERRWQEHGQPKDRLIPRGVPLAEAEKLVADFGRELPAPLVGYVNASRRQARLRQRLVAAAALFFFILAVAATGAGLWAFREQRRAEETLAEATATANALVFDLAQRFRNVVGMPAQVVKDILDKARALQEQLVKSGQVTPALKHSEAAALTETVDTLLAIGDTKGALATAEQARQIFADLVAANPGGGRPQRDLSLAYVKVGDVQVAQGDLAAALKSYQASLAIRASLAQSDPGNAGWQNDVAASNNSIGSVQVRQGDLAAALKSYQASLDIIARVAKSDSGNTEWQHDLSVAYESIGDVQFEQGDLTAAVASYQADLAAAERLAKSDPGNSEWQRGLSVSHDRIGDVQVRQGDLAAALKSYQTSLAIRAQLTKADPGNAGWQNDLWGAYSEVGDVQLEQGDLAAAVKSYRAGHAIADRLAKSDPSNAAWQRSLSVADEKLGDVQLAQRDLPAALASYQASLAIRAQLTQSDPGNTGWQRDLAVSYESIGEVQVAQGDLPGALKSYQAGVTIVTRLAQSDPGNAGWQHDLAVLSEKAGEVQAAQGDLPGALKSFAADVSVVQTLAKSHPENAVWRRDLSVGYEKSGDVQIKQGDVPAALKSYQASLVIRASLAQSDPGNTGWQRDLAVAYNKIGDAQFKQGDLPAALKSYRAALAISERLARSDPSDAALERDLIVSYVKMAGVNPAQARTLLTRAEEIAKELQAKGLLAPSDAWIPDAIARRLAVLKD